MEKEIVGAEYPKFKNTNQRINSILNPEETSQTPDK